MNANYLEMGKDIDEYRDRCLTILKSLWREIDWDKISIRRRMNIYEEMANKIKSSALTSNLFCFIENMMKKFEIGVISDLAVIDICKNYDHQALLRIFREETFLLVLMLKEWVENKKS